MFPPIYPNSHVPTHLSTCPLPQAPISSSSHPPLNPPHIHPLTHLSTHLYTYLPLLHPYSIYLIPIHSPMHYPPHTHPSLTCPTATHVPTRSSHFHPPIYTPTPVPTLHASVVCVKPAGPGRIPGISHPCQHLVLSCVNLCQPRGVTYLLWLHLRFHGDA